MRQVLQTRFDYYFSGKMLDKKIHYLSIWLTNDNDNEEFRLDLYPEELDELIIELQDLRKEFPSY